MTALPGFRRLVSPLLLLASAAVACSSSDRPTGDSTASVGANAPKGGAGPGELPPTTEPAKDGACPEGLPGPRLVRLTTPKGVAYCMDRTEVTQRDYAAFLAVAEKEKQLLHPQDEPSFCKYDYKLVPDGNVNVGSVPASCASDRFDPIKMGDVPMNCVDACAAMAFCAWAGKELCGAPEGGPVKEEDASNPEASAFYNACSNGGATEVAVPDGIRSGACRLIDANWESNTVESKPACHGDRPPFDQVLNLAGNAREMERGPGGNIWARGARYVGAGDEWKEACSELTGGGRSETVGFRCCKPLAR